MNILYINHYAGSPRHGMEFRPYYLAREWVRMGNVVQVVAASFSHVRARQPSLPEAADEFREDIDGINYRWIRTPEYASNGICRLWNIAAFLRKVNKRGKRLSDEFRPSVVIASSTYPFDVAVAARIAKHAGARLVFEVHDLWPLSLIEIARMSRAHPFVCACGLAERFAYRRADLVVSMLPHVHEHMKGRGLDLARLAIIPNGVAPEEWGGGRAPVPVAIAEQIAASRREGKMIVGYLGSHGVPNALEVLLQAARLLDQHRYAFVLVGDGMEKANLQKVAIRMGLQSVYFFPPVPKASVPAVLDAIDIAYIGWRELPIYRFGIAPNKLLDYMMGARPVVHSVRAANDIVSEADCGRTVAPEDPEAAAAGIRKIGQMSLDERVKMGERGRNYVLQNHSYSVLAERFLSACNPRTMP